MQFYVANRESANSVLTFYEAHKINYFGGDISIWYTVFSAIKCLFCHCELKNFGLECQGACCAPTIAISLPPRYCNPKVKECKTWIDNTLISKNASCKSHFHTFWFCIYARPRTYARMEASPITLYRENLCTEAPFPGRKEDAWSAHTAFVDALHAKLCNKFESPLHAEFALANSNYTAANMCFISTNAIFFF